MRKKLPIGIQTFARIREDNCYYVDKTAFALQLIEQGNYYFLSRPRRFGKSLFLDTLKELFEGNEPLFRGLFVHDKWDWSIKYPVIRISFGGGVLGSRRELDESLHQQLSYHEKRFKLPAAFPDNRSRFIELIRMVSEQCSRRVVILIDEYDKPILDRIDEPDTAADIREGLKDFYSVIKDSDPFIKFTFFTGVSKFSKVSLFSGLNNLEDITIERSLSAICGYTDDDVDTVFAPELDGLDREQIRLWYNGYNWTGESVYNPFDLLLLFKHREFRSWWFETGTPTFLIKLLSERQVYVPALGNSFASGTLLSTFDVGNIPTEALMFQTGYLTFDTVETIGAEQFVTLRYPNREVQQSLTACLLAVMVQNPGDEVRQRQRLYQILKENNFDAMRELFHSFYASIPCDWYRKNELSGFEGYYASIFYSYFASLGVEIHPEDPTNKGRIDMAVRFNGHIYLFEFKVVEMVPAGRAMEQLKEKGYADKYRQYGEPIHLIGIEFSSVGRNIVGFEVEDCE